MEKDCSEESWVELLHQGKVIAAIPKMQRRIKQLESLLGSINSELDDFQGEWASVTTDYCPENLIPLKHLQEDIQSALSGGKKQSNG
jgi:hypothetical protein